MDEKASCSGITRTLGDGMDSSLLLLSEFMHKAEHVPKQKTFKPIIPKGIIIKTVPKYVPKEQKVVNHLQKSRDPKFVPYEPFKCAVHSIIPRRKLRLDSSPVSKNNIDILHLVHQMSEMRLNELKQTSSDLPTGHEVINKKQWHDKKLTYENDIKNLRESNSHLENQLKFQAQVNSELKTLLVAAVGEDLETRVQHLTEDKLQLARALLNSANHLTSHQEQTEWLLGQCEVWKSKFLSSSVMVEELAKWKSALTNKTNDLLMTIRQLLEERNKIRSCSLKSYNNLLQTSVEFEQVKSKVQSTNIVELSSRIEELTSTLVKSSESTQVDESVLKTPSYTYGEKMAIRMLKTPITIAGRCEAISDALIGATVNSSHLFLSQPTKCCRHCKGEVVHI